MGFCKRKGVECDIMDSTALAQCKLTGCFRSLPDVNTSKLEPKKENSISFTPNLNVITGIVDTESGGKKFAIGTKNNTTGFVLNFGNRSCLLFTGDIHPIDLRQFNFDEFESIEINGNKFVKEHNND